VANSCGRQSISSAPQRSQLFETIVIFRPTREPRACNRLVEGITANCLSVSKSPDSRLLARFLPSSAMQHRIQYPASKSSAWKHRRFLWMGRCSGYAVESEPIVRMSTGRMQDLWQFHSAKTHRTRATWTSNKCDKRDNAPERKSSAFFAPRELGDCLRSGTLTAERRHKKLQAALNRMGKIFSFEEMKFTKEDI